MSLSGNLNINVRVKQSSDVDPGASFNTSIGSDYNIVDGTASGEVDLFFYKANSALATTSTDTIDLSGSLIDLFGNTIIFAKIMSLVLIADSGNLSDMQLDQTVANSFLGNASVGAVNTLKPGTIIVPFVSETTGFSVTAGTADLLNIKNPDVTNTASYKLYVLGTSV